MLLDDIILWANTLPHWQKMISYYILHSIKIDEIGMDKIYEAFKRERDCRKEATRILIWIKYSPMRKTGHLFIGGE